jgi:hypothetical protein
MRLLIRQNHWNFWGLLAALFLIVPAAKPSILEITFPSGANVGDGGTITTDGCSVCSDGDITGFDFTLLGFEFMAPASSVSASATFGNYGSLLGNASVLFFATGSNYPSVFLSDTGMFDYDANSADVENPATGQFSLASAAIAVPEPSSLALILAVLLPLGFAARFRSFAFASCSGSSAPPPQHVPAILPVD